MIDDKKAIKEFPIIHYDGSAAAAAPAAIIREVALQIKINGKGLASIACAGNYPDELALGFLRSERIISSAADIAAIDIDSAGHCVTITLRDKKTTTPPPGQLNTIASSGARSFGSRRSLPPLSGKKDLSIGAKQALVLMEEMLDKAELHNETHGTHCSALAQKGKIIALREDIGRHNTIDMLGGFALLHKINLSDKVILTTGRISSEIVYKVWNLGIPAIISHSAPTARAIELLQKAGITLIGYVRGGQMNIYTHERRVKF